MENFVRVIGAGLAGCEVALQLAGFGIDVKLYEMKPNKKTPAQKLDGVAELVCSNSFRSKKPTNAVGLLKEEMLMMNSFLIHKALKAKVPAGDALAVDREIFSSLVEKELKKFSNIQRINEEVLSIWPDDVLTVVATGPLTSQNLAFDLIKILGKEHLDFYDAIAPVIDAESIDMSKVFKQDRFGDKKNEGDYINCPLDKATYEIFIKRLNESEKSKTHDFENAHYFEGCLPIEVLAKRGVETLRFGPFKPVGLFDPTTSKRPHAVLQLRKEDIYGSSYNLVGCQTKMTIPEQREVFGLIPALKNAKFLRYGSLHRNTYVDSPKVLDECLRIKNKPNIFLAGQITGVEGYVESIACGLIVANMIKSQIQNKPKRFFPKETLLGGLYNHVRGNLMNNKKDNFVPSNVTWAMVPPLENINKKDYANKKQLLYERAKSALINFLEYEEKKYSKPID